MRAWLASISYSLLDMAIDRRLISGQKDYVKFIVLGRSRTGSNFLLSALNGHRQVMTFSELFRDNVINWESHLGWMSCAARVAYTNAPLRLLETRVYRAYPPGIRAVGFKLFYYHARTDSLQPVWNYLQNDPQLHVIHIKRRNILESHVSRKLAGITDHWIGKAKHIQTTAPSVALDFDECQTVFQETRSWEIEADAFFAHQPKLEVMYEDLAQNFARALAQVEAFLGLGKSRGQATTRKQSRQPLAQTITNYHELKARFAGTPWAEFFTE